LGIGKIIKRLLIVSLLLLSPAIIGLSPPAVAEDDFTKGCQLYTAKSYSQAEPLLTATVKKFPLYWPGHYYLAHTLLALGQRTAARKEYEACLASLPAPGAEVVGACQKVIVSLGGTLPDPSAASTTANPLEAVKSPDGKVVDAKPADAGAAPLAH
jgi:tetratricopeptide (TPR) repeat protein